MLLRSPFPWLRGALAPVMIVLCLGAGWGREPTTIRFQYWGGLEEIPSIERIVSEFNASHPDIRVIAQRAPGGGSYTQKLLVQVAGGVAPDVVFVEVEGIVPLVEKDVLVPLNPYLAETPNTRLEDYYPEVVARFTHNGHLYILPRDTAPVCVVYYNKALFDEAGIPYPLMDWRWDTDPERVNRPGFDPDKDFLSICRRLTRVNARGRTVQWAYSGPWTNFAYSTGARLVDNEQHPTRFLLTDPRVVRAVQLMADMQNKWGMAPRRVDVEGESTTAAELFIQGRLAMFTSGIWDSPTLRTIEGFDWDVAQFPRGPTGGRGWETGGSGYGITRDCRNPRAAWEFVRYIAGPPGQTILARNGRAQPALATLARSGVWRDEGKPLHKADVVNDAPRYAVYMPFTMAWPAARTAMNNELDLVWSGHRTAEEAMRAAQTAAQRRLDEYRNRPTYPLLSWPAAFAAMATAMAALVGTVVWRAKRELGPNPTRARVRETLAGYLAISPWIVGFLVFTAGPLTASLVLSFCQWDVIGPARWSGLANFRVLWRQDELVPLSLRNTVYYTVFSVPLGIAVSLAVALLLNAGVRGMRTFRTIYYLPAVTSAVAASVLWKWIFNADYGLLNFALDRLHLMPILSALGLTNPDTGQMMWLVDAPLAKPALIVMSLWGAGGGMIIYLAGLQGIPRSLYEAADIDGAGPWRRFLNVTLPMLTPTIFFSLIVGVIGSFQVFTQALVMTDGGPYNATLFYVLHLYRAAFQMLEMGYASALAWVMFFIILAVTLVQFRFSRWVYYEGGPSR